MNEPHAQVGHTAEVTSSDTTTFLNAEWLASLNHELRSPLAAIQGYTNLLLRYGERIAPQEQQEFLQAIHQGSERMTVVLNHLLDLAYFEVGSIEAHPVSLDMVQLVQNTMQLFQQGYSSHDKVPLNVSLTIQQVPTTTLAANEDDPSPFMVVADRTLLQKLLFHLLDNAQKYAPEHTMVNISLSIPTRDELYHRVPTRIWAQLQQMEQSEQSEQSYIELCVHDQGIGIPDTAHERIFERFQRLDLELNRTVSGLGLGLTICKYIVELHHGAIWVESTPGKGSSFYVLLPTQYQ